jgi:tRNA(Met) C34 N-acetyltransferase TmcA
MCEHNAYVVPTLITYEALAKEGAQYGLPADSVAKIDEVRTAGLASLEIYRNAGVKMGYGSRALSLLSSYYQGELSPHHSLRKIGILNKDEDEEEEEEEDASAVFEGPILTIEDEIKSSSSRGKDGDDNDNDDDASKSKLTSRLHVEKVRPRRQLAPLLVPATEMKMKERLHWLGVGYGLTNQLFDFWRRSGYLPLNLRQTAND